MPAIKKPVYYVWLQSKMGTLGMQPVKANNKQEAKRKFKKRFPKSKVLSIEIGSGNHISEPI